MIFFTRIIKTILFYFHARLAKNEKIMKWVSMLKSRCAKIVEILRLRLEWLDKMLASQILQTILR